MVSFSFSHKNGIEAATNDFYQFIFRSVCVSHDFFFISFFVFFVWSSECDDISRARIFFACNCLPTCMWWLHVLSVAPNHIGCCILTSGIDLCSCFFICYFQTVFDRHETFWVFVCNIQWSAGWLNVGCVESFSIAVFLGNINVANVKLCVTMALTVPYHDSTYFKVTAVANSLNWKVCPYWTKLKVCINVNDIDWICIKGDNTFHNLT